MFKRSVIAAVVVACVMSPVFGHFVFVVPDADGAGAQVIVSETLSPDEAIDISLLKELKLSLRDGAHKETALGLEKGEHALNTKLTGTGTRVIHGIVDLGVTQRGEGKPNVLIYYPKTILGDAFDARTVVGKDAVAELVPVGKSGELKFRLLGRGKPLADAEVTVILPDGAERIVKTDKEGLTDSFDKPGRYGAWARFWEATPGEREGKKYDELRHYATLVIDAGTAVKATAAEKPAVNATVFAKLPEKTSSFGAVETGGWLYIYGGHVVPTHNYSTEAVSGKFFRVNLAKPQTWESLPSGPGLQGMNLAAHNGKVIRVGGMAPHNKAGEANDLHSIADVARFDPASGKWDAMLPLPVARSSHDVAVIGDTLLVMGGWNLRGKEETQWPDTMLLMDLKAAKPEWKSVPQPFKRRALIATANAGKLYVIGGFDENSDISRRVDIYDLATNKWSSGPELPDGETSGFAPAAAVLNGRVYASVADGTLYRLNAPGTAWEPVGNSTPRLAHRMVANDSRVLVIGGAAEGDNFDLVESITPGPLTH